MKIYNFLPPYSKTNSKWIKEPYVRTNVIETSEKKKHKSNFGLDKGFLDNTSKSKVTKEKKICNQILVNFTMFASKDTIN